MNKCIMTDEELLREIGSPGEAEALDEIFKRYKGLVRKKARTMFLIGGEQEDLIQEGMIGLLKAVRSYSEEHGSSFAHYADICVSSKMYSAIESSKRQKHIPLNSYISLYEEISDNSEGHMTLLEVIESVEGKSPEELFIIRENMGRIDEELERQLSGFEREVMNLHLTGFGYVQIAEILGKTPKQVDNALQRMKIKLHQILGKTL